MADLALPEDSNLRRTGIRFLGEIPWGTHVCVFYETREDLPTSRRPISRWDWTAMSFVCGGLVPRHRGRCVDRITR